MTRHSQKRSQQRGLSADQATVIAAFGDADHHGRGGILCLMNDNAMARLIRALGPNQVSMVWPEPTLSSAQTIAM